MSNPWTWARFNPRMAMFSVSVGIVLAFLGHVGWVSFSEATAPKHPTLRSLTVTGGAETNDRFLLVKYTIPPAGRCIRFGQILLYHDDQQGERTYHALGGVLNGQNLSGTVANFTLSYHLPKGMKSGKWYYLYRMHYECPPNGAVRWAYTTPPVEIEIQ